MEVTDTNEVRNQAADVLDSAAQSLRNTAVSQGGQLGTIASKAAEAVGCTAGYLRQHDLQDMAGDVQDAVKRYPGASLAAAASLGFLLGVALKRR